MKQSGGKCGGCEGVMFSQRVGGGLGVKFKVREVFFWFIRTLLWWFVRLRWDWGSFVRSFVRAIPVRNFRY